MQSTLFGQLGAVARQYRIRYVLGGCVVLVANVLVVINPLIFRHAVALYDRGGPEWTSAWPWALGLLVVASISAYLRYQMRMIFIGTSRYAEADLRRALFDRLLAHSQPFFDRHRIGALMSRLVNDVAVYREVLGPGIMYPINFLTMVIPAIIVLFGIAPRLALISLIPVLAIPPLMLLVRRLVYRYSRATQEALADMSTLAQETYQGIRLIKSFGREEPFLHRFHGLCRQFFVLGLKLMASEQLFFPLLRLIGKGITVLLVLVASYMILGPWGGLSTADLVSFMWVQSYILLPVLLLGFILPLYQRGRGAYSRLVELYQEPVDVSETGDPSFSIAHPPSVRFEQLTFSYPDVQVPALAAINASIEPGCFIGITGPPGAGKSTLFALLGRDYPVPPGMVMVSGHDVVDLSLPALHHAAVAVEQEPFLFSRTIAENIALARPDATQAQIEQAAKRAAIHDAILRFPVGYQTLVGERGVTLSGGQKQRVALARAFLLEAPLLLLDDCFSALDAQTAERVIAEIRKLTHTTVLLITHRVALLAKTDEIFVLQRGKMVERGVPVVLAKQHGYYAALVALESKRHDS